MSLFYAFKDNLYFQKNLCRELVFQSEIPVSYFELIYAAVSHKQCYRNWWNLDNCKERLQKRHFVSQSGYTDEEIAALTNCM